MGRPPVGYANQFAAFGAVQVLGQTLLELANTHIGHVDILLPLGVHIRSGRSAKPLCAIASEISILTWLFLDDLTTWDVAGVAWGLGAVAVAIVAAAGVLAVAARGRVAGVAFGRIARRAPRALLVVALDPRRRRTVCSECGPLDRGFAPPPRIPVAAEQ